MSYKVHELKIWPQYFGPVADGRKTFEVRINDRDFKEFDHLILMEWDPTIEQYTGQEIEFEVTYIYPLEDGRVVMALGKWDGGRTWLS